MSSGSLRPRSCVLAIVGDRGDDQRGAGGLGEGAKRSGAIPANVPNIVANIVCMTEASHESTCTVREKSLQQGAEGLSEGAWMKQRLPRQQPQPSGFRETSGHEAWEVL